MAKRINPFAAPPKQPVLPLVPGTNPTFTSLTRREPALMTSRVARMVNGPTSLAKQLFLGLNTTFKALTMLCYECPARL